MVDKAAIVAAIKDAGDNISKAARRLGVARRTLQARMRYYGISKGKPGRRKMRITYSKRRKLYTAAAIGTAVVLGAVVIKKNKEV